MRRHIGDDSRAAYHPGQAKIGFFIHRSVAIEHFDPPDGGKIPDHLAKKRGRIAVHGTDHFHRVRCNHAERPILAMSDAGRRRRGIGLVQVIFENLDRFGDGIAACALGGLGREQQHCAEQQGGDQRAVAAARSAMICNLV